MNVEWITFSNKFLHHIFYGWLQRPQLGMGKNARLQEREAARWFCSFKQYVRIEWWNPNLPWQAILQQLCGITFISRSLFPHSYWFTDLEARGSDHIPTYITIKSFPCYKNSHRTSHTDWDAFRDSLEATRCAKSNLAVFQTTVITVKAAATKKFRIPLRFTTVDVK